MNESTGYTVKVNYIVNALLPWFAKNARDLPWRRTTDPYAIWVSEIMLQQTQVKAVLGYWERWMQSLPTIESLAMASPARIHKLWEGLGYYTRVRNMQKAAQQIMSQHDGEFPRDYDAILELPGIGRYTAGAISSIAFNEPRPILDGNVTRVLTRVFGIEGNVREKPVNAQLWQIAEQLVVASPNRSHLNQSLMELGALICTPKQPKCAICPARKFCVALATGKIEKLPNLGKRVASAPRHFVAFVLENGGRYLVRQRPAGVVNAHLWEFPNAEAAPKIPGGRPAVYSKVRDESAGERTNKRRLESATTDFGLTPGGLQHLCTIKHTITRYRITLEVFRAEASITVSKLVEDGRWLKSAELRKLAFTSAHRRILARLK